MIKLCKHSGEDDDEEDKEKSADGKNLEADDISVSDDINSGPDRTHVDIDENMQIDKIPDINDFSLKMAQSDGKDENLREEEADSEQVKTKVEGEGSVNNEDADQASLEGHSDSETLNNGEKECKTDKFVKDNDSEKSNLKIEEINKDRQSVKSEQITVKKELSEEDIERELKRELREAVEIRIPKVRTKRELSSDFNKWASPGSEEKRSKRAETPPLQKLMKHDFSPLRSNSISMHSPPKRFKDSSYSAKKEGFTSKLASVIIPSTNSMVSPKTASHPKQLLSHSLANLRTSSYSSKSPYSTSSLLSRTMPISSAMFSTQSTPPASSSDNDQPLDLSKKPSSSGRESSGKSRTSSKHSTNKSSSFKQENGTSSTSLQSLQQKFGGDFHLRGLQKPLNYMLYGPEIPALHQALLHSATLGLPHFPLPFTNGLPKYMPEKSRHRNSTPSPSHKAKSEEAATPKPLKKDDSHSVSEEKPVKRESISKTDIESDVGDDKQGENYTNHLCTCGKWFDGLYSLSLHLQETGHLPARNKSVNIMEYPKLVRGQDMWLNQESEQTRRILRCIQCGESFKTLPLLTVHMMKTQHYTKIVSSEHARRAHKCSAYCDKETDKDCVFKCKVCQDTFTDMEGLANHMLMSGHHKKQSSNASQASSVSDLQFKKRKRYSFEEALHPFGNPSMAAMLEYKRRSLGGKLSPELSVEDLEDSRITCENCGNKIETKLFVDHVRACLGQKLREDVAKLEKEKENLRRLEKERKRSHASREYDEQESDSQYSPKKQKLENDKSNNVEDKDSKISVKLEKTNFNEETKVKTEGKHSEDEIIDTDLSDVQKSKQKSGNNVTKPTLDSNDAKSNDSDSELEAGEITSKTKNILKEIQTLVESKSVGQDIKREPEKSSDDSNNDSKKGKANVAKTLDIIDPNVKAGDSKEGSALSAMESFIKKSFSNKFDYKKGNIIISPHTSADATVHPPLSTNSMAFDGSDYINRYQNFYAALNLNNGYKQENGEREWGTHERNSREVVKNGIRSKLQKDKKLKSSETRSVSEDEKDEGRNSVKSEVSDSSSVQDREGSLENKYLSMDEGEEETAKKAAKSSALDNLSSFVYGQTMTSEHPLDSLQKLITKSDIPKLMAGQSAGKFKYLPPHLQMHQANLDLPVPLNLSVKSPKAESEEDHEDARSRHDDNESLSDYEALNSPSANSDGEPVEYRCAACSRRFASKGSYRYHLSRCHLSSVKKYGIKEAFNMSPYVYLPLDHTAKFSKYYEMAKELANKAKENRAKSN